MQQHNVQSLESLSWFCHLSGLVSVVIGMGITLMNLMNKDFFQIQSGLFIFISGYAQIKISAKISMVINSERVT